MSGPSAFRNNRSSAVWLSKLTELLLVISESSTVSCSNVTDIAARYVSAFWLFKLTDIAVSNA